MQVTVQLSASQHLSQVQEKNYVDFYLTTASGTVYDVELLLVMALPRSKGSSFLTITNRRNPFYKEDRPAEEDRSKPSRQVAQRSLLHHCLLSSAICSPPGDQSWRFLSGVCASW